MQHVFLGLDREEVFGLRGVVVLLVQYASHYIAHQVPGYLIDQIVFVVFSRREDSDLLLLVPAFTVHVDFEELVTVCLVELNRAIWIQEA